jgi:nucleotide-binding universal stress UspA family protein
MSVEEFEPMLPPPGVLAVAPAPIAAPFVTERLKLAEAAARRLQQDFPGWQVSAEAGMGVPAYTLLKKAAAWQANLLVAGSHGRSALGRFVLGSVSQKLVTEAACAVRVARGRSIDPAIPPRLIIGVDGSPGAEAAVRAVASRTWPAGTEVRVVAAIDEVISEVIGYLDATQHQGRSWLQETLEAAEKTLLAAGLDVLPHLLKGDPKHVLLKEADKWDADCLFVGARSMGRLERLRLGSVSAAVTARAHCSVEVVR